MPLSIGTAAQNWNVEHFSRWDPTTDTFGPGVVGRKRRIDPFVSLWSKASRRANLHFVPGSDTSGWAVVRHDLSGDVFLLSATIDRDAWQGGSSYNEMYRAHKVTSPSGGKGLYTPVTVSGSGDNLGPVVMGPDVVVYLDVERSGSGEPRETVDTVEQEVYVFCSSNAAPKEGDFLTLNGVPYRVDEAYFDTGFQCTKTVQAAPAYTTVVFSFPGATAPVYDPSTGGFTIGTWEERQVSVLTDESENVGRPTDRDLEEAQTLYIYTRHIGFSPLPGMQVAIGSRKWRVTRVDSNLEGKQWKVRIEP